MVAGVNRSFRFVQLPALWAYVKPAFEIASMSRVDAKPDRLQTEIFRVKPARESSAAPEGVRTSVRARRRSRHRASTRPRAGRVAPERPSRGRRNTTTPSATEALACSKASTVNAQPRTARRWPTSVVPHGAQGHAQLGTVRVPPGPRDGARSTRGTARTRLPLVPDGDRSARAAFSESRYRASRASTCSGDSSTGRLSPGA